MTPFAPITPDDVKTLRAIVGDSAVIDDPKQLQQWSRDSYWYSPVLKAELDEKCAEVIVRPGDQAALIQVIAYAFERHVPITLRGAGTGNYGQGVPLHGGILLDTKALTGIIEVMPERIRAQAGAKLIDLERAANGIGAELRFYPSTVMTATAGGFLAGGSSGIGSVTHGTLWDPGNVLGVTIVTVEAQPRVITVNNEEELRGVIHNCGLTCVIADLTFALAPRQPWEEYAVVFADFTDAFRFGHALASADAVVKRLVSVFEPEISGYFKQLIRNGAAETGKALVLLELANSDGAMRALAAQHGGRVTYHSPPGQYHSGGMMLSDFTWNHTTLWAMKAEPAMTYLQDLFDPHRFIEQHHARKEHFGDSVLTHIEFMRFRGELVPQGLSLVRFTARAQLWEIIEWCEANGFWVANPHTHRLDEDVRWNGQPILDAKSRWDPRALLNPGHLGAVT